MQTKNCPLGTLHLKLICLCKRRKEERGRRKGRRKSDRGKREVKEATAKEREQERETKNW